MWTCFIWALHSSWKCYWNSFLEYLWKVIWTWIWLKLDSAKWGFKLWETCCSEDKDEPKCRTGSTSLSHQLDPPSCSAHFYYFLCIPTVTVMLHVSAIGYAIGGLQKCTCAVIHTLWLWLFSNHCLLWIFWQYFNTNVCLGDH